MRSIVVPLELTVRLVDDESTEDMTQPELFSGARNDRAGVNALVTHVHLGVFDAPVK